MDKTIEKNTLRNNNLYGAIKILSPDGAILCRCNEKKANWYLSRNLAERKADDCIVLRFKPKGFGDTYSTIAKQNICVVCGSTDRLSKHHIIPKTYRQHFPVEFKSHLSHDCVLLCIPCHEKYERISTERQLDLAKDHGLPPPGKEMFQKLGKDGCDALAAIGALLDTKNHIPAHRKYELWGRVERYLKYRPAKEELQAIFDDLRFSQSHGELLVSSLPEDKLIKFIVEWRKHFIRVMKPNFLPRGWAITYRTHYTGGEFELFRAYEAQVKAFQEGLADAKAKTPRKDLSNAEIWVQDAYETGYSITEKEN